MNLLTSPAPWTVEIQGQEYELDADFRNFIKFEQLMEDPEVEEQAKGYLALHLFFETFPADLQAAFGCVLQMYAPEPACSSGNDTGNTQKRIYSFEHDADFIFAAFLADYGLDLNEIEQLHWWKFRALFKGLKPDNMICKIMEYRAADLSKLKGEEKKFYQRMKKQFALPVPKSEQEKCDKIAEVLMQGGNISEVLQH